MFRWRTDMSKIIRYNDEKTENFIIISEIIGKMEQICIYLNNKINSNFYQSLPKEYLVMKEEISGILEYSKNRLTEHVQALTELYKMGYSTKSYLSPIYILIEDIKIMRADNLDSYMAFCERIKGERFGLKMESHYLINQMTKTAEGLIYSYDLLESMKAEYIQRRKTSSLRRKGINPMLYDIEAAYRLLSKLEDNLDVISISVCDRLDSRPDDSDYMSLLMRATDLSNKLSEARYQISSIMDKMISKSGKGKTINGKSDLSAHDMKLVFELKASRREVESAVKIFSKDVARAFSNKY